MERRVFLGLAGAMALSGCGGGFGQSRANPRNWFGRSRARPTSSAPADGNANPLIPQEEEGLFSFLRREEPYAGTPVAVITELEVQPAAGGALIRAEGLTLQQGAFEVRLIPDNPKGEAVDGVLGYELRAVQPDDTPQGPERARLVLAGVFVSNKRLEGVREIRVRGTQTERISRR